ncbi:MAG: hypothetical protein HQM12_05820 [SAR324 cluster bacterium]|nr:hypothetical protein [SAR324 cluster bacterium]
MSDKSSFLYSKRVLCISKADQRYYIIEVGMENNRIKVFNSAIYTQTQNDARSAAELRKLLKIRQFKTDITYASLLTDQAHYQRVVLPDLSSNELKAIFNRNIEKLHNKPVASLYFDNKMVQTVQDKKGNPRWEHLLISMERPEVDQFDAFLRKAGLKPVLIAPMNMTMSGFCCDTSDKSELENKIDVYVYVGKGLNTISFMQNNWFVFSREFFLGKSDNQAENADIEEFTGQNLHRFSTELSRSIQYFQQNFRDYHIKRVILCGMPVPANAVGEHVVDGKPLEVNGYDSIADLDIGNFQGNEAFKDHLGLFSGALSLALGNPYKDKLNLLNPPTIFHKLRFILGGLFLGLILCMGILFFHWNSEYAELNVKVIEQQGILSNEQAVLAKLQQDDSIRSFYHRVKVLTEREIYKPYQLSHYPYKKISQVIPKQMILKEINTEITPNGWIGNMTGIVEDTNADRAKRHFDRFYSALQASPLFSKLEARPLKISEDNASSTGNTVIKQNEEKKVTLRFDVTFELVPLSQP